MLHPSWLLPPTSPSTTRTAMSIVDTLCQCSEFSDLGLNRKEISNRIKATGRLIATLEEVARHDNKENILYRCCGCGQLWQRALAWNWGNEKYLFQVPSINKEEWLQCPFVDPDAVLIWSAVVERFLQNSRPAASENECRQKECHLPAIKLSVNCLRHHIESIQRRGQLPGTPSGRWLESYSAYSPKALDAYVARVQPKNEA